MDIILNGVELQVYTTGEIFRYYKSNGGFYREIYNVNNHIGYNQFQLNKKKYYRHRIIAYCYLGLNIDNGEIFIDHIDHDTLNNNVENLRLVSNQQNQFNRSNVKGYYYSKRYKKYVGEIRVNRKKKFLGYYATTEEAHNAYLEAKEKYHKFN